MRTPHILAILLAAAVSLQPLYAREPDATLGLIQTPNDGMPAIVTPGGTFDATLKAQAASISLTNDSGAIELNVEWTPAPGSMHARCTVPENTPPGPYAIQAGTSDRTPRSVFVRQELPEYYVVAHLTDVHIGDNRDGVPAADIFGKVIAAVNASPAAFALITGDLTHNGQPEQFQQLLAGLNACTIPTFLCPGNHDRTALNYERFFGPLTYMFRFGQDGYIVFDTKDFLVADALDGQNPNLERYRRATKPCRWTVGATHRFEPGMDMRAQLILFVDDPLDHLLFGHWHQPNTDTQKTVPWGTTPITVTPAAIDGQIRYIDVSPLGVKPRQPEKVNE